jgi:hypothetical protein
MSRASRPPIPAAVRRAILVEAGHKCAIPRCGHGDVDIHHIVPWETCGKHEYANLISLCPNCHRRAHKGEIDRKSLHLYKAALVASFQVSGEALFSAPAVEIERRIYEVDSASAECSFSFEFPDFVNPMARIVSKNIEAWGLELLATFRQSQDAEHRLHPNQTTRSGGLLAPTKSPDEIRKLSAFDMTLSKWPLELPIGRTRQECKTSSSTHFRQCCLRNFSLPLGRLNLWQKQSDESCYQVET